MEADSAPVAGPSTSNGGTHRAATPEFQRFTPEPLMFDDEPIRPPSG
jgi:hypothetical protein